MTLKRAHVTSTPQRQFQEYVEGCPDCVKDTKRWLVIYETAISDHVSRYHTQPAAKEFYDALDNHTVLSRTLAKLVEYENRRKG